jgi:hypothetical protein
MLNSVNIVSKLLLRCAASETAQPYKAIQHITSEEGDTR